MQNPVFCTGCALACVIVGKSLPPFQTCYETMKGCRRTKTGGKKKETSGPPALLSPTYSSTYHICLMPRD